ncbi:MAG: lysostaphin resistance A-like protein [Kiritimatiellia bacterium]
MIPPGRYTFTHALAATAALGVLVFYEGFGKFWRQFVYGLSQVMTPQVLWQNLLMSTLLFGTLLLVLWGSTLLTRRAADADEPPPDRRAAVRLALCAAPALTLVALGLNWLGAHAIEWCTGVQPADQELVKCFTDGNYSPALRAVMVLAILLQAPLLEEAIFRGVIFRGFARRLSIPVAVALSGAVFALVHVNAATFVALWFLGAAFAWLYHRTGSILAPMTAHAVFNATNLALLFLFPELASN